MSALLRVTVEPHAGGAEAVAGARLLVSDGGRHACHDALPLAPPEQGGELTLGFALSRTAIAIALELGHRLLVLPEPRIRPLGGRAPLATVAPRRDEDPPAPAIDARRPCDGDSPAPGIDAQRLAIDGLQLEALRCLAQQLCATQARLDASRLAATQITVERDDARSAALRAEAVAYGVEGRDDTHESVASAHAANHGASAPKVSAGVRGLPARLPVSAGVRGLPARLPVSAGVRGLPARLPGFTARTPGVPASLARRVSRRTAVAACALSSTALALGFLGWPTRDGARDSGGAGVAAASGDRAVQPARPGADPAEPLARRLRIPVGYLNLYRSAGARYGLDWTRLAAVGAIESTHGQARAAGVSAGSNARGARGPAQFLTGTWERFGVDGDDDGLLDPHDPADAIPAMASYLRASGAPQDWRVALRSYNHSDAYVDAVERLAARYRRSLYGSVPR